MSQQAAELKRLIQVVKSTCEIAGPLSSEGMASRDDHEHCGAFSIFHKDVLGFLQDQGLFVWKIIKNMSEADQQILKAETGQLLLGYIDGVSKLFALRDDENNPIDHCGQCVSCEVGISKN